MFYNIVIQCNFSTYLFCHIMYMYTYIYNTIYTFPLKQTFKPSVSILVFLSKKNKQNIKIYKILTFH